MAIQESGEMYLETIHVLTKDGAKIRAIDVGEYMGFSKPSVSRALGLLRKGGYLTTAEDGYLKLTEEGRSLAEKIYERHGILTRFLVDLGVDEKIAAEDACKMEHHISDESFEALKAYATKKLGK